MGIDSLKQKLQNNARSGFDVWQDTVDMTKGELPKHHDTGELSDKIKEIRERKIWMKVSDVEAVQKNYVILDSQKLKELIENRPREEDWTDPLFFAKRCLCWFKELDELLGLEAKP